MPRIAEAPATGRYQFPDHEGGLVEQYVAEQAAAERYGEPDDDDAEYVDAAVPLAGREQGALEAAEPRRRGALSTASPETTWLSHS